MTPAKLFRRLLAASGLHLATYSPCDGMTRYRFFQHDQRFEYFASSSELFTALGRKEAITFLRGYRAAQLASPQTEALQFARDYIAELAADGDIPALPYGFKVIEMALQQAKGGAA